VRNGSGGSEVGATWALIAAAGSGERLGIDRPKAFAALGGRPLLAESLDRLDRCEFVDAIVVAAPPGWEEPAILLAEELAASKVVACVTGGTTRTASVAAALFEEGAYDSEGNLMTTTMATYLVPSAAEVPSYETDRTETAADNPLGVKGVGETGTIAAAPAVINAVVDALSHLGVTDVGLPATPERVWKAIEEVRS